MTQAEPMKMVDYWKIRLGLHSWRISIKFVPRYNQPCSAETFVQPQMERADITAWSDSDRDDSCDSVELDVLHELVHIRLWAIDPYEATGVLHHCREAAIEWLARALYVEHGQVGKMDEHGNLIRGN
jgi:hypothetical protein